MHPIETYNYISKAISDSYERDAINGDAKSRAEWFSYALGTLVLAVVGTKGMGAVSKTGNVSKKISNLDLLPYKPKNQLATDVVTVPYNVLNGNNLKDKLLSMAEMDGKDTHKGTGKTYQTYRKTNPITGEIYTGRTSGTGTPLENIVKRDAIRGREQQLIDLNGGAKSKGGTSGNKINGISDINPNKKKYLDAADKEW